MTKVAEDANRLGGEADRAADRAHKALAKYTGLVGELNVKELRRLAVMRGVRNAGHWHRDRLLEALGAPANGR
jgi:hypothetical protein